MWDTNVEAWADAHHPPDVRAMQRRNFAASAPPRLRAEAAAANVSAPLLRVTSGHSDAFYLPRAVVPLWGELLTEAAAGELMQEHVVPSAVAATAMLRDVHWLHFEGVPRLSASASGAAGDVGGHAPSSPPLRLPDSDGSHPWKWSVPRVRAFVLDAFRERGYAAV